MDVDVTGSGGDAPRAGRWLPRLATAAFLAVVGGFDAGRRSGRPGAAGRCPGRRLLRRRGPCGTSRRSLASRTRSAPPPRSRCGPTSWTS